MTVTANSIRAAILSRGDEIGIMQPVGAPLLDGPRPFVIEGALTGAVAGGLAGILALVACVIAVQAGASSFAQITPRPHDAGGPRDRPPPAPGRTAPRVALLAPGSVRRHLSRGGSARLGAAFIALLLLPAATPASADAASDLAAAQARAQLIESVRYQLGSQLATALQTQDRVVQALRDNAAQQSVLQDSIATSDANIAVLEDEVAKLTVEVETTQSRIRSEKAQITALARAIYAQPSSVLLLLVESTSVGDMITRVNDLRAAGSRARRR